MKRIPVFCVENLLERSEKGCGEERLAFGANCRSVVRDDDLRK